MKNSVIRLILLLMLVSSYCFAGGQQDGGEMTAADGPQYGGTLNVFHWFMSRAEPTSGDMMEGAWTSTVWSGPHLEKLLSSSFETDGPRGSGEYPFKVMQYTPDEYLAGALAESWEVTADNKIIFKIRKGVMWTGREGIMEAREFTAKDAEYNILRYRNDPKVGGQQVKPLVKSVKATDDYTLVVEMNTFRADWPFIIGYGKWCGMYPREVVENSNLRLWENHVGTGPFMVKEQVEGSYLAWERNPNYWRSTTIDGEEYQLPFVDQLVAPVLADESTLVASLRTGKLDWAWGVPLRYEDTLAATSPDLVKVTFNKAGSLRVVLNTKSQYFSNRNLRRAMMIGTDLEAIGKAIWKRGELHTWPVAYGLPESVYTPLEKLPDSAKILYSYDPELAKQMIVDEGYPDGFKIELQISSSNGEHQDISAMLKSFWDEIGATTTIVSMENTAYWAAHAARDYNDIMFSGFTSGNPIGDFAMFFDGKGTDEALFEDEWFEENMYEAITSRDADKRNALVKEMAVRALEEVCSIPFVDYEMTTYYWPWVQNYFGEVDAGYMDYGPLWADIWIDESLK